MGFVTNYCLHPGLQALLAFLSRREALTPIGAVEVLGDFELAAGPHVYSGKHAASPAQHPQVVTLPARRATVQEPGLPTRWSFGWPYGGQQNPCIFSSNILGIWCHTCRSLPVFCSTLLSQRLCDSLRCGAYGSYCYGISLNVTVMEKVPFHMPHFCQYSLPLQSLTLHASDRHTHSFRQTTRCTSIAAVDPQENRNK